MFLRNNTLGIFFLLTHTPPLLHFVEGNDALIQRTRVLIGKCYLNVCENAYRLCVAIAPVWRLDKVIWAALIY